MSEAELIFNALAELSTRQIAESVDAAGMKDNLIAGIKGGKIAKKARLELKAKTGKKVVTGEISCHLLKKENYLKSKGVNTSCFRLERFPPLHTRRRRVPLRVASVQED